MKVKDFFAKFDNIYIRSQVDYNTKKGYRRNIELINNTLGDMDVNSLTLSDLDRLTENLYSTNHNNTSIRYVYRTFNKAMVFGIRRDYVEKNIISSYDLPKVLHQDYKTLNFEEVSTLLLYLSREKSDIFVSVLLACLYGLRRGECLGLKTFDLRDNILSIRRTAVFSEGEWHLSDCKTEKSRRDLLISSDHLDLLNEYNEQRPKNDESFFVRDKNGKHITQNQLQRQYKDALLNCGLPNIRFHDLRHTYATLMLHEGVNPKIVSTILGHANVGVTLDIYSHADVSMQSVCVDIVDKNVKIK